MNAPRRLAALVCAAGVLLSFPLCSQDKPSEPIFADQIDVRVVNVEIVVTDRQGNRVTGLKPDDFRLLVDRKPVAVEYFTEVREGEAIAASPGAADRQPSVETGGPVGTNYLIFVDDLFSIAAQRDVVLKGLVRDLSQLGPRDRVAIVAWDGRRLTRLADWSSGNAVAGAIRQAMMRPTRGLRDRIEQARLRSDSALVASAIRGKFVDQPDIGQSDQSGPVTAGLSSLSLTELAYGSMVAGDIAGTVSAVVSAMRAAGAPEGRKVMLLLCGGWPFTLEGALRGNSPRPITRELPETEPVLRTLTSTANLLGYTVYPVDVPGLTTVAGDITTQPGLLDREGSGPNGPGGRSGGLPLPLPASGISSAREQEVEGSLHFIAKETGGKPMLNGNRELALARASADTRTYYWLGFTPAWRRDGKTHRLEVKVRRPFSARSRTNFADLSRAAEMEMTVESALLFGDLPAGEPLTVHLGTPASAREKGLKEIPLTLEIPVSAVTLLPAEGKYVGRAELRLAAADERGNESQIPMIPVELSSPVAPAEGQTLHYETRIFLRGQASRVVAVLYDPLSGKLAAGAGELDDR